MIKVDWMTGSVMLNLLTSNIFQPSKHLGDPLRCPAPDSPNTNPKFDRTAWQCIVHCTFEALALNRVVIAFAGVFGHEIYEIYEIPSGLLRFL
jgi:hypothetical protein